MNDGKSRIGPGIFVLGMALTLYWAITYAGPYRFLAEWQLKRFGSYSARITGLAIGVVFLVFGELVRRLLRGAEQPVPGIAEQPVKAGGSRTAIFTLRPLWPLILIVAPAAMGVSYLLTGMSTGALQEVQIADVAAGGVPSHAIYAEIHGYLGRTYVKQDLYSFVPIQEAPAGAGPIHVLIGVDEKNMDREFLKQEDGSVAVRGMLEQRLSGEVRYMFENHGITVADPCWVLHTGRTPAGDQKLGAGLIIASIIIGMIWGLRRSKQSAKGSLARPLDMNVTRS